MKKIKLIMPMLAVGSLTTLVVPLTSCSNISVKLSDDVKGQCTIEKTEKDSDGNWIITLKPSSSDYVFRGVRKIEGNGNVLEDTTDYVVNTDTNKILLKKTSKKKYNKSLSIYPYFATSFAKTSWKTICEIAATYEDSINTNGNILEFICNLFTDVPYKEDGATDAEKLINFVGKTHTVTINGLTHQVRVIDVIHDKIADSQNNAKALFTFESETLLSCPDGSYMGVHVSEDDNNYVNGSMYKALNSNISNVEWYQYDSNHDERKLPESRSLIQIISDENSDLGKNIKSVVKQRSYSSEPGKAEKYEVKDSVEKIFPLTYTEIGLKDAAYAKVEGSAYKFWTLNKLDIYGVKKPIGAIGEEVEPEEYWLASPKTNENFGVWTINSVGVLNDVGAYYNSAVDFAFCI